MTTDEIIDKLNMLKFFYGQRSGLELWNEKPTEVQEKDIETTNIVLDAAIYALEHQKWIPCSERMPEGECCFLSTNRGLTTIEYWDKNKWLFADPTKITAWKPLPEPYREEQN